MNHFWSLHFVRWARSTQANFDLGHRLFLLGPVLLRPGATQANFCSFDHPKCQDEKKKEKMRKEEKKKRKGGTINIVRVSVKASPAEGRRHLHTNTACVRLLGFNGPSCGASPVLGFRGSGVLGFRGSGV